MSAQIAGQGPCHVGTDAYWTGFMDGVLSAREDALTEGYRQGYREAHDRALTEWVEATFSPSYEPKTAYIQSGRLSPIRVSDRPALTAAQIAAGARWSWAKVERRIAERGLRTA